MNVWQEILFLSGSCLAVAVLSVWVWLSSTDASRPFGGHPSRPGQTLPEDYVLDIVLGVVVCLQGALPIRLQHSRDDALIHAS